MVVLAWLDGRPLGFIQGGAVYRIHADHLGAPQVLTDGAGAVAWSALYAPFGAVEESGAVAFNLRLPGQYHDRETGYYYNYHRTYDPSTGRYVESDPIGLGGGWNTYGYVGGNPVMYVDTWGLDANTWAYGEIRQWCIVSPTDFSAPAGLPDAKASIAASCGQGQQCADVDGSNATAPGDRAAWNNIVNAQGGVDRSGGGEYMCVGTEECVIVQRCTQCRDGQPVQVNRPQPLQSTGDTAINGNTLYFYTDPLRGWCNREDYRSGCQE